MDIRIAHCTVCWGYRDRALALGEALRKRFGANVEVVGGRLGQFDVYVDSRLVAPNRKNLLSRIKRFPDDAEIIAAIERQFMHREESPSPVESSQRNFSAEDATHFYDRFGGWQDVQFYERAALENLVAHSDFEHASAVCELGCGTGRFAELLLEKHLPANAQYVGMDISTNMVGLALRRLKPWSGRATVQQGDATTNLSYERATFDRFIATYVLDLLPQAVISHVMTEAVRLLGSGGKLCLVTLTEGATPFSRLVTSLWKRIYLLNPRLVGGCRPLQISLLVGKGDWQMEHTDIVTSWGISSEIVVASPIEVR